MKSRLRILLFIFLQGNLLLTACNAIQGQTTDEAPTEVPVVIDDLVVMAEGRLVPNDSVWFGFVSGGQVAKILVDEGDLVRAGDVIARLGDREQLEAAVVGSELEVSSAELEIASAELELLNAQQALDTIHENWPDAATAAQQALTDARQAVHDTERRLRNIQTTASKVDIDSARSTVVLAEDALDKAKEDFKPYENKPLSNLTRAVLQGNLAVAQKAYDNAVRRLNGLQSTGSDFDVSQAEADFIIAQARLELAQEDYALLLDGPDPDDIAAAKASIAIAEAHIATAQERARAAQASLVAAQANLDNLDLVATIDGTVVELDLIAGEQISPGTPVVLLVDFSKWYVETDNLTEIEVVDVTLGQQTSIVPDALSEVSLVGSVESINDMFEEKRGDITYTTRILVDEIDPRLRWGMTVVVTFEE